MLPSLIALMNDLGIGFRWAVIRTERPEFFFLTKRIHNLIHGDTASGIELGPEDARLYEAVNVENASSFKKALKPDDILIIHDPPTLADGTDPVTGTWDSGGMAVSYRIGSAPGIDKKQPGVF